MPTSTCAFSPIDLHLPGANAVMGDIPVGRSTSPSSLELDHEQLTRTAHYTHEGKSIAFEIVNKPVTLTGMGLTAVEVDPIPENTFKNLLNAIFRLRAPRKTRRAKAKTV